MCISMSPFPIFSKQLVAVQPLPKVLVVPPAVRQRLD
jgi:hypothetical protein